MRNGSMPGFMLEELEKEILGKCSRMPRRRPWIESERAEIINKAGNCLGVRDEWIPRVRTERSSVEDYGDFSVELLRSESWKGCFGAAHLWLPRGRGGAPLVFICCGHGKGGKRFEAYRLLAAKLAMMGSAVMVTDNIGQGEREPMGHKNVIAPFQGGFSLQGMIVMETLGWLDWALADGRFDPKRIAAVGNSGGGALTLFLGAFAGDRLAALSSSGYPSTFEFIARKEKKHCHCNIIPGIVGELEMWQVYGCFAPRPIFLFQGAGDCLFPRDIFEGVCRKTRRAYRARGAEEAFRSEVFKGGHSWDGKRRESLAEFLRGPLKLRPGGAARAPDPGSPGDCYDSWPDEALSSEEVAARICGANIPVYDELWKVYCPSLENEEDFIQGRVGLKQLAAQFKAFTAGNGRPGGRGIEGEGSG